MAVVPHGRNKGYISRSLRAATRSTEVTEVPIARETKPSRYQILSHLLLEFQRFPLAEPMGADSALPRDRDLISVPQIELSWSLAIEPKLSDRRPRGVQTTWLANHSIPTADSIRVHKSLTSNR